MGAFLLSVSRQGVIYGIVIVIASHMIGYHGVLAAQAVSDFLTALMAAILLKHELWSELTDIKGMKKQYRSSIIKRKYRCRKEDMDHVIRKAKKYLEEKGYADRD